MFIGYGFCREAVQSLRTTPPLMFSAPLVMEVMGIKSWSFSCNRCPGALYYCLCTTGWERQGVLLFSCQTKASSGVQGITTNHHGAP